MIIEWEILITEIDYTWQCGDRRVESCESRIRFFICHRDVFSTPGDYRASSSRQVRHEIGRRKWVNGPEWARDSGYFEKRGTAGSYITVSLSEVVLRKLRCMCVDYSDYGESDLLPRSLMNGRGMLVVDYLYGNVSSPSRPRDF